jgi:hypothetical protein
LTATILPGHSASAENFTAGSLILLTTTWLSAMIAAILIYMKPKPRCSAMSRTGDTGDNGLQPRFIKALFQRNGACLIE